MRAFLTLCCLALLAVSANAWWCTGHMIIAEIARMHMDEGVEDKVNAVIAQLKADGPFDKCSSLIPCACWADDLKSDGLTAMAGWHFINQPYDPSGFKVSPPAVIQHDNVAHNINTLEKTAKDERINNWEREFAIANLLHFMGDVSQPLHATELYSAQFPHGDLGGNKFEVFYQGKQWRLHFIWDSVCGLYQNSPVRPPTEQTLEWLAQTAQEYDGNYSALFNESEKHVFNGTVMAEESYEYAIKYAYNGLKPGDNITDAYIKRCIPAAGRRITVSGYRLANEMNYVFGSRGGAKPTARELHKRLHTTVSEFDKRYAELVKEGKAMAEPTN